MNLCFTLLKESNNHQASKFSLPEKKQILVLIFGVCNYCIENIITMGIITTLMTNEGNNDNIFYNLKWESYDSFICNLLAIEVLTVSIIIRTFNQK